jgi:hypothetical protein
MSDDPLYLGGLNPEAIAEAGDLKKMSKKAKDPIAAKNAQTAAAREERLQSKGGGDSGGSSKPAPAPPPPDVKDISGMLDKVAAYKERFPHLKSRNKLSGKSTEMEIEDELHYLEQQLGSKDGHMGTTIYIAAMTAIEQGSSMYNPLNLNLTGLGAVARQNIDQVSPIIDELVIKYATNFYVTPEMRLCTATAMMIYTVHAANTGNPTAARAMAAMNQSITPQKSDL